MHDKAPLVVWSTQVATLAGQHSLEVESALCSQSAGATHSG